MSYDYDSFQLALASEMVIPNNDVTNANFQIILPTIIDYAEQRIYRELDLIYASSTQTATMTAGSRILDLSGLSPYILIIEDINIITPSTTTNADLGERNQTYPVTKEWLDAVWGNSAVTGVPKYFTLKVGTAEG